MHSLPLGNLIGRSSRFRECLRVIHKVAASDATLLIQGETGTGKELAARAVHYLGGRRDHPFIPVNCGALPDSLMENEMFGHARGAFTDARDHQPGLISLAERGTLFLDEIETISARGQVILLRFLEDRQYRPLGARQYFRSDVRVIAASNADLAAMVHAGTFRKDLLYRLAIVALAMPPLRERADDIPLLSEHFLERFASEYRRPRAQLHPDSVATLAGYVWPGNVRELENLLHRAVVMADSGDRVVSLPSMGGVPAPEMTVRNSIPLALGLRRAKELAVAEFERSFIVRALDESHGNVSQAARIVGKERRAFGKLVKKYSISTGDFRELTID